MVNCQKKALVIIAKGTEEMEAVITIDILRRADILTTVGGIGDNFPIICRSETKISPDNCILECLKEVYDVIIIPGGLEGVKNISTCQTSCKMLKDQYTNGRMVAAICAGPTLLHDLGILKGHEATVYPSLSSKLTDCIYLNEKVVVHKNVITSQGPGTSFDFALKIVSLLCGKDKMASVAEKALV